MIQCSGQELTEVVLQKTDSKPSSSATIPQVIDSPGAVARYKYS
jgi:hypothetical protein